MLDNATAHTDRHRRLWQDRLAVESQNGFSSRSRMAFGTSIWRLLLDQSAWHSLLRRCSASERRTTDRSSRPFAPPRRSMRVAGPRQLRASGGGLRGVGTAGDRRRPGVRVLAGSREGLGFRRAGDNCSLAVVSPARRETRPSSGGGVRGGAASSRIGPDLAVPKFSLDTTRQMRWPRSAGDWTVFRWPSNWPRPGEILSVEEIRTRLDDRFRLLTGGSRTAMGRQQTLLATIQWSYDHLAAGPAAAIAAAVGICRRLDPERCSARSRRATGRVCDAGSPLRLVDQSLINTHRVEGGTTRYSMLETVRQYAT